MKGTAIIMLLALSVSTSLPNRSLGQTINPSPYCELDLRDWTDGFFPAADTVGNGILNVTLETLNNSSRAMVPKDSLYKYYNLLPAPTLIIGSNYTISLRLGAGVDIEPYYYAVWIDFNRNEVFDEDELIMNNANSGGEVAFGTTSTRTRNFTIPAGSDTGLTRMRITRTGSDIGNDMYIPDYTHPPCFAAIEGMRAFGEVEDYNVRIVNEISASLEEISDSDIVQIYPNPAKDYLFINTKKLFEKTSNTQFICSLINLKGEIVMNRVLTDEAQNHINISELSPGIFNLRIETLKKENLVSMMLVVN